MEICSIGASGTSAERFFKLLEDQRATAIIDTRVHATSQLAGFTRKDTLAYLSERLLGIPYIHEMLLAPRTEDLKAYRAGNVSWEAYESQYANLLTLRTVDQSVDFSAWGERPVLLCSEQVADFCHRRLAAEYLRTHLAAVTAVTHL